MTFDVLTTTATDLQQFLTQNKLTSVQIVQSYFGEIDRHEPFLNALISLLLLQQVSDLEP